MFFFLLTRFFFLFCLFNYLTEDVILQWEDLSARIVRPDVNAINGIIHVIDNVLMVKRDMMVISGSPVTFSPSTCVLTFIVTLATWAFRN